MGVSNAWGVSPIYSIGDVYVTGSMNGWATNSSDWKLGSGNHCTKTFYLEESETNYTFKLYLKSGYYTVNGYWFTKTTSGPAYSLSTSSNNMEIQTKDINAASGYVKLDFDFWGEYSGDSRLSVTQSAVAALSPSLSASSTSLIKSGTSKITASCSGGSGSYTYTYKVTCDGSDVTNTTLSTTTGASVTFTAPSSVTGKKTYTITVTAKDSHALLSGLATKTATKTITVEEAHNVTVSYKYGSTTIKANTTTNNVKYETASSITASTITGYKFSSWTLGTGIASTNANTANPIKITTKSSGTYTLTANYTEDLTSTWHIVGTPTSIFKGTSTWAAHNDNMLKKTTGASTASKGSLTIDVKTLPASNDSYQFKVLNTNGTKWYGWSNQDYYWMNGTKTTNVYNDQDHNLYFIPDALGDYKFDVDWSSSNPSLKVTFPTAYAVTFGKGTGGSSVTAKYNSTSFNSGTKVQQGKTVTFTQSASAGYTFKEWNTKSDGTGTKLSTNATYTHTVAATNTVYAIYTPNPDKIIYLEPTGYWNSDNPQFVAHVWGSGGKDITMTGVGEAPYKYYTCEVPAKYTNILFYRKSTDGSTIWNQTADLEIPTDTKTLYEILSTGEGTSTKATGVWKEANLVYTITLGSSMFGPYGISYNGQSYFSKDDADVVISLPYGATINFIEGQPYSDIYTGGIMERDKTRQIDLTQPYTIKRDIKFDANYVTKVPQVAYLGVPNSLSGWAETDTRAQYIWRYDSQGDFLMEEVADRGTFEFEVDGVKYYKYTIKAGCNKFRFQHKTKSTDDYYNQKTTHHQTNAYLYEVLTTDVNCYMLDGGTSGGLHTGYWCALPARTGDYRLLYVEQVVEKDADGYTIITRQKQHPSDVVKASEITQEGVIVSLHTYKERTYQAIQIYDAGGNHTYYESSNNPEIILQRYDGSKWVDEEWHMVYGPLETLPIMGQLPGRKNASPTSTIDDLQYHNGIEIIKNDLMPNGDRHPDQGNGVWNFVIKQKEGGASGEATIDLEQTHRYTGEYYIRTNAAFGEWNSYKGSDNHMTRSDVSKRNSNYSHYYCKWIDQENTNVTYTIANDYGMAISDTLTADETDIWGTPIADAQKIVTGETLPTNNEYGGANIRFSWNEKSNFLHRAYLAGSTDVSSRFLVLEGISDEIYNAEGEALTQGANGSDRYGLKANEEIFTDISNWVYYADVQMVPNAGLKLTAKYMDKVQYFIGQEDQYNNTVLAGTGTTGEQKYLIRLLYDFKTNELISAYVPGGNTNIEAIETNLMLIRKENAAPTQLSFNTNNMKDEGKQAYGVLELTKATLIDNTQSQNIYERSLYWISFPFDVRITDIFGFGEYGKHWIIQSYDGEKRAREGLWLESETNWVYHFDPNTLNAGTSDQGIMKRGVGYVVALDLDQIKADNPFVGRITTIALYFPSTNTITEHIVNRTSVTIDVPEHVCTINRNTPEGDRRVKDSHWNVIGVPSYINAVGNFGSIGGKFNHIEELQKRPEQLQFYYRWLGDYDKYEVTTPSATVNFNSLTAYMVQYAGDLTWTSVLNEGPASLAAKRNSDEMEQYHLCLELQQNGQEQDRTFLQLQEDEVTAGFDFNYDLCKIINKGANIYSLIATDRDPIEVAGNVLPVGEAIIPLGIQLDAAGEYTFAMPDGTDGITVELIDYETNTRTNMLLDEYTVNLGKGTFETRFALHVKPDKTATGVENIGDSASDGKSVKKFIIDGILYMQKDGALYNAQGHIVR